MFKVVLSFVFAFFALEANAQIALNKNIDVTADVLEVNQNENQASFKGKVRVVHGDVKLNADELFIDYTNAGDSDIKEVVAKGNVSISASGAVAVGKKAVYSPVKGYVEMTGGVVMTRGESVLTGESLMYDITTGKMSLNNTKGDGRVKASFSLKGKKDN